METPDPFTMYLREIARERVLTREEEREVARRVRRGDKEAEQALVVANLRLVVKIARGYSNRGPTVLDLIQEGNVGLLRAARKYDPERGTRFSTYASFCIRASILKHLVDSWSVVKIGTKDCNRKLFYHLNKEKERLKEAGLDLSVQLLAENLGVRPKDVEDMEKRLSGRDLSLEGPLYEGGEEFMDTIASGEDIEETVAEKQEKEMLQERLGEFKKLLDERERFILECRIMAEEPATLGEIGERFNVSREWIRQLQVRISTSLTKHLQAHMR